MKLLAYQRGKLSARLHRDKSWEHEKRWDKDCEKYGRHLAKAARDVWPVWITVDTGEKVECDRVELNEDWVVVHGDGYGPTYGDGSRVPNTRGLSIALGHIVFVEEADT